MIIQNVHVLPARLHVIKIAPPFWEWMIENNSDFMITGVHIQLELDGAYSSVPQPGWSVIYAQGDGVTWVSNSTDEGAGYGYRAGFELVVPVFGDAFNILLRNTPYALAGDPSGAAVGEVATPFNR